MNEHECVIRLSDRDTQAFLEALDNPLPPSPSGWRSFMTRRSGSMIQPEHLTGRQDRNGLEA